MFYPSESALMRHIANHPRPDFSKGFFSEIMRLILSAYFGQGMCGQPKESNVTRFLGGGLPLAWWWNKTGGSGKDDDVY